MGLRELLKNEKEHYGKIFVDISYAIDNITPFITSKELADRKYVSRLPVLKKYIESIEAAERDLNKSGFLGILSKDKYSDLLREYKRDHYEELNQLEKCSKCFCLNCTAECKFEGCGGCRNGENIVSCDHECTNAALFDSYVINLINERTGADEDYNVMAIIEDIIREKRYIVIEGIRSREKFILYYNEGISEDTYGEITDEDEFSSIVEVYESLERN